MIKAFYSDPHFGHKNIIKLAKRPFNDIDEMHSSLIGSYNALIERNDTVLWLGDCAFCGSNKFKAIMDSLNGKKLLVIGNHDRSPGKMSELGFDVVMNECIMNIAGRTCRINHFPYINAEPEECRTNDRFVDKRPVYNKNEILIHGHTHSKTRVLENMIHVGVDAWPYRPVLLDEIEKIIEEI